MNLAALSLFGLIGTYHILHLFLPNIVMAHNAKLTFPIIEDAPGIVKLFFSGKCPHRAGYFPTVKRNGSAMRSLCQNVIARR